MTATAPLAIQRHSGGGRSLLALVGGVAALGAVAATWLDWRLLVPIGLGLPLLALVIQEAVARGPDADTVMAPRTSPLRTGVAHLETTEPSWRSSLLHGDAWLAGTFTALFFTTSVRLIGGSRSPLAAASGNLSMDNAVELTATVAAALVVASALRNGWMPRIPRLPQLFGGFAFLAVLSVTWSQLPLFSAARAFQFAVLAAFVAYCSARAASEPGFADRLLVRFIRYIAVGAVALGIFGVLDGGLGLHRFTWRGSHPNTAAAMMLAPCLGLLFHPRRSHITRPLPWWVVPLVLLPLVHATGSRANVAGAAVAVVCAWFVAATRDSRIGAVGFGGLLILAATTTAVAADRVAGWLLRGQGTETVTSLNGRVELWEWVLANPLGSEIWGIGIGAARGVLPVSWNPTNVHSAWIDILQTLGVLGLTLMGAVVVSVIALTVVRRSVPGAWLGSFVAVSSLNSITISQPGVSLVLLLVAIVMVSDGGTQRAPARLGGWGSSSLTAPENEGYPR